MILNPFSNVPPLCVSLALHTGYTDLLHLLFGIGNIFSTPILTSLLGSSTKVHPQDKTVGVTEGLSLKDDRVYWHVALVWSQLPL